MWESEIYDAPGAFIIKRIIPNRTTVGKPVKRGFSWIESIESAEKAGRKGCSEYNDYESTHRILTAGFIRRYSFLITERENFLTFQSIMSP